MKACKYQSEPKDCLVDSSDCHSNKEVLHTMKLRICTKYGYICFPKECKEITPYEKANS